MTTTISQQAHDELWQEAEATTPLMTAREQSNQWDWICQYPPTLGQGLIQRIQLREGICLWIKDYQLHDDLLVGDSDYFQGLGYVFFTRGIHL
ncbi:MAG: hypothetical protein V7K89_27225 [Nostoc sp.]|uniref:hypothetical protein n=1 Tax=Nostoc sp. TaxID=1180 RepID=UPI002FF71094